MTTTETNHSITSLAEYESCWQHLSRMMDDKMAEMHACIKRLAIESFSSVDAQLLLVDRAKELADEWRTLREAIAVVGETKRQKRSAAEAAPS